MQMGWISSTPIVPLAKRRSTFAHAKNPHSFICASSDYTVIAGFDLQQTYLKKETFEAWEADDPLLHSARLLIDAGILNNSAVLDIYQETEDRCTRVAKKAVTRPRLKNADQ